MTFNGNIFCQQVLHIKVSPPRRSLAISSGMIASDPPNAHFFVSDSLVCPSFRHFKYLGIGASKKCFFICQVVAHLISQLFPFDPFLVAFHYPDVCLMSFPCIFECESLEKKRPWFGDVCLAQDAWRWRFCGVCLPLSFLRPAVLGHFSIHSCPKLWDLRRLAETLALPEPRNLGRGSKKHKDTQSFTEIR